MIAALWGDEKSWKTTMALTWPRPLAHFDLDVGGFDRAKWRLDTEGITSKSYPLPIQIEKMMGAQTDGVSVRFPKRVIGYKEVWQQIVIDFVEVCKNPEIETIVMDSATQLWSICHTSLLQEKQEIQLSKNPRLPDHELREKLQPVEFPNDRMRSIIYTARSSGKHLVLTHYPKFIYKEKVTDKGIESYKTDEITPDGFKDTQKLVDIVIWVETGKDGEVSAKITRCGLEGLGTKATGLAIEPSYQGILDLQEAMK